MAKIESLTIERERSWLWRALPRAVWIFLLLAVLALVAYLVVTSSGFIKRFILPRVSAAIHADVTVTDISVHPFSNITVHGLKVQVKGREPVVTASEVRASYSLWSILRGNPRITEIALVSPTVNLVENPDGTSNVDALKASGNKKPSASKPPHPGKTSPAPQIEVRKVTVSNATYREIKNYPGNRRDALELTDVNLKLASLKNGQPGNLQFGAGLQMDANPPAGQTGHLQAAVNGNFNWTLSADLKPAPVTGQARFDVSRASGAFGDFSGFSAVLECDVTPTQIKQAVLHFQRAGAPLGELAVSGPLDMAKMEGRLRAELRGIDRRLLNLAAEKSGIDFDATTVSSSNDIELTKAGAVINATGRFDAGNVQLTRAGQTTPALNLDASYAVTVDRAAQTALLRGLNIAGTQNGNPLLAAHLTRPMTLAWGRNAGGAGDSALDLTVTGLNLADWKPFLGNGATGNADLTAKLTSQQGGRQLNFDLNSQINNFAARIGGNQTLQASVNLSARGQAVDFKQFNLAEYRVQAVRQNQTLAVATGSGTFDTAGGTSDMQVAVQLSPTALGQALPRSGVSFSSGSVELKGRVTQKRNTQTITGKLVLAGLTGRAGQNQFQDFGSTMDLDVGKTSEQIQINKITGQLASGGMAGGTFEINGKLNPARESAQLNATLSGFNQNGLRPFLEPMLAGRKLISITVNGNASVQYDSQASSAIKSSLQVANLVVNDPQRQLPAPPLEGRVEIDTAIKKQSADVRQFQITLTPTKRAQNQIRLQGQINFSQPGAARGNLKLTADSLDVTSYYDLFAGGSKGGNNQPAAAAQPGPESAAANQEPPAKIFPLKNFTVTADIGHFYLREIEITHWQTMVTVDGGHVTVKPFQLALNGAPVNATADLNLGVPGYRYDVALSADRVPLAPWMNTFKPDRKGQMGGTVTAQAKLTGAGVTGASLQRNLTGQFAGGVTNLNLAVENVRNAVLRKVVSVVATLPQLLNDPLSAVASWIDLATGRNVGLMDTLRQSPIQIINAQIQAGGGRIDLQSGTVQSAAFKADGRGGIALAPVLTNSAINIPIAISVNRPIARQLNLISGDTSASAATYFPLPQFLTVKGTLGNPKADIDKLALGGTVVKSLGSGIIGTTTNAASQVGNLLNGLLKKVK